jgi:hypothetical protein
MHNLNHQHQTNGNKFNFNFDSSVPSATNKSMSLSHPSLTHANVPPRANRQLTTISSDRSPLWTALTTAQVISVDVDVDYVEAEDENS